MNNRIIVLLTTLILAGCGGGGGSGTDISAKYTGNTAKATITESNAQSLSVDAIQGAQSITEVGVLGKRTADTPLPPSRLQSIAMILEESVSRISVTSGAAKTTAKTVAETAQGTQYGYSGSFSYSANGNQSTGALSGTITFNAYQADAFSAAISGQVSFSGTVNTTTGDVIQISMSVSNLSGTANSRSFTINGTLSISNSGTTQTLTMSMVTLDNTGNKTYWAKDFSFVHDGGSMTVSGTYYDHTYGYVVITTISPLAVSELSGTPTSGQLLFAGNNQTKARLTYTSTGYTLEADVAGNDTYIVIPQN